jgi:hypothetical protein
LVPVKVAIFILPVVVAVREFCSVTTDENENTKYMQWLYEVASSRAGRPPCARQRPSTQGNRLKGVLLPLIALPGTSGIAFPAPFAIGEIIAEGVTSPVLDGEKCPAGR